MKTLLFALTLAACALSARAETLVDRLLASYDGIQTVACDVRKITETPDRTIRRLSHVHFQKPDRIHVHNVSPLERRYVADGEKLHYFITGDPRGYAKPIAELDPKWIMELRKVPGTAMDHLMRLQGAPETDLAATEEFPVRKGYAAERTYAVLSLDAEGRLARVEFFTSPEMTEKTGQYDYSEFKEVLPGVWIPCLHKAAVTLAGVQSTETVHVDDLVVNEPVDESLFIAAPFFAGVEFVDSFEAIYEGKGQR
ncbi:MAG: hypothetical protein JXB04_09255 [Kiritimatiellae bacterium]|nr:hypothetical protein [Kiritimatiellia bacterium]